MADSSAHEAKQKTKVAIVGTGLAGLTTGYALQHDEHKRFKVTLFEQSDKLSLDSASVAVKNEETGLVERVDLPMRASAGGYYANLLRMYEHLGIPLHPVRFLFVFAKALSSSTSSASSTPPKVERAGSLAKPASVDDPSTYFVHASNLHQTPPPWPGTRGVIPYFVEVMYLIICHFWFSMACFFVGPATRSPRPDKDGAENRAETFEEYVQRIWLPRRYVTHYILPLMSSVSTCSHEELLAFPASDLINYKKLSHGQQHYAVCGGVRQVESKLADEITDVRLAARVLSVDPRPTPDGVLIRWQSVRDRDDATTVREEVFDRVVLAVSPDVVARIFEPLADVLHKMPTRCVESSVLTSSVEANLGDQTHSVVPAPDPGRASVACMHHSGGNASAAQTITFRTHFSGSQSRTEALHVMPGGVTVSTCPLQDEVKTKQVLKSAVFTRTLRTTQSRATVERIMGRSRGVDKKSDRCKDDDGRRSWVSGQDGVWLAGSWCWDGMVLLEGCVVSAMSIADDFGVAIPWRKA